MSRIENFEVFYRDGYACLRVYPTDKRERRVYPEDVTGRLKILDIRGVRQQKILDAIDQADGTPVPIAVWPEGKKLGPKINIEAADDGMSAAITVSPERQGGEPLSEEMLLEKLRENGIVHGIDRDILSSIVLKKVYNHPVKAVFGTEAVDERPAEPDYRFLVDRGRPFRELEFQRIDLKELNFIDNRQKGDLLAVLKKPQPPVDGMDIFGREITASRGVSQPSFLAGEGAVLSEDGHTISAEVDGNVRLARGKVIVEPLISVEDVDYSNGNMDFNGSVDIKGRIADGFRVKAKGDIQIGKSVSRVNISGGGDIILKAGITGNDEGLIVCDGDLYARYIESASIVCKGNVFVEEAVMHSRILAGGDIILGGKRAEIFGGRVFASGNIKCKKLGSINEPVTELFLGISLDSFTALEALQKTVREHTSRVNELDSQISKLKNALGNAETGTAGELSREKLHTALAQLTQEAETRNKKLSSTLRELHELKREIELDESSQVHVEQQIYGKVHVYFSHLRWDSPRKGTGKTNLLVKQGKLLEK